MFDFLCKCKDLKESGIMCSLPYIRYWTFFSSGIKQLGHDDLMSSLRMSGAVLLLPLYSFTARTGTILPLLLWMSFEFLASKH